MDPLLGQEYQPLKASNEDVSASLSHYYEAIANFEEPGKKKEASITVTELCSAFQKAEDTNMLSDELGCGQAAARGLLPRVCVARSHAA